MEQPARHPATEPIWAWLEHAWVHGMKPERAAHVEDTLRDLDATFIRWDAE